jgi:3-oxoacyl-[acyl-carrier-protein] synthase-3
MTKYARIVSSGSYLPEKVLTNKELESRVDTSDEWITERTGIKERRIAGENETSVDLAYKASIDAISKSNIDKNNIGAIFLATCTPERKFPSSAVLLQNKLNIKDAFSFDINAACTGFVYALDIAKKYIESGQIKYALVVGTEKITSLLDWADRNTCVLFGDGAGAMIVAASNEPGIISSTIGSDGSFKDLLTVNTDLEYIEMKGSDVFKTAVNTLGKLAKHTLEINSIEQGELDWLVPHQANERIILAIAKKINLSKDKIIITVNKHGNTSAASIPLAFDTANSKNTFKSGDMIMLEAFGAGFTWGSVLLKY